MLDPRDPVYNSWGDVAVGVLVLTAVWVWGDSRRVRRAQVEMIEERAVRAESERDEQARLAVREERARIAREMHDIVAHSVSVMVVQAGAARRLVGRDPQAAAEAAGLVEATGRDALREMRRAVGVLRAGGEGDAAGEAATPATLEPQPALSDVPALVDRRTARPGSTCACAPTARRARCRRASSWPPTGIIQEALTNTMKHAGPARAEVRSAPSAPTRSTVVVADDGRGAGLRAGPRRARAGRHARAGHGVRRRARRPGLTPGGGFRVRARLPLEHVAAVGPEAVRL